jgi:hypothetical protein
MTMDTNSLLALLKKDTSEFGRMAYADLLEEKGFFQDAKRQRAIVLSLQIVKETALFCMEVIREKKRLLETLPRENPERTFGWRRMTKQKSFGQVEIAVNVHSDGVCCNIYCTALHRRRVGRIKIFYSTLRPRADAWIDEKIAMEGLDGSIYVKAKARKLAKSARFWI